MACGDTCTYAGQFNKLTKTQDDSQRGVLYVALFISLLSPNNLLLTRGHIIICIYEDRHLSLFSSFKRPEWLTTNN